MIPDATIGNRLINVRGWPLTTMCAIMMPHTSAHSNPIMTNRIITEIFIFTCSQPAQIRQVNAKIRILFRFTAIFLTFLFRNRRNVGRKLGSFHINYHLILMGRRGIIRPFYSGIIRRLFG